ncbi:peptide chain release factor N(5)-glutamine methyltransferase [Ferrimonas sediminicola]|uniref:Release factor glutamine methyltransferase n=1 Tax=Ferrimonas sediminicola TaxID=2569538 RepID=A0A4V5NXQ2_9GAMM|nr:peptide chain release factor N(5)-glutamine methyltransferase [Ferrimonas sediminicola]TKB49464.1 peptide chain release factor N(5)-glutamine methyltransferase [Ferrimonas sediminicola]
MRLDQALTHGADRLHGGDSPQLDAQLLLCFLLDRPRTYLYTWPERELTSEQLAQYEVLLARRAAGEPVAHITGVREFWSLPLKVNSSTLIPRPDTEALVEYALGLALPGGSAVVDLGTGTGAIALALASERPDWVVTAVDLKPEAVALAKVNRDALGLEVEILQSSWFGSLEGRRFDLVISNPPYIEAADPHLGQGDVRFEPLSALTSGEDGLVDITHIVEKGRQFLNDGGTMVLEHGYNQGAQVRALFGRFGYTEVGSGKDLAGRERYSFGRLAAATKEI